MPVATRSGARQVDAVVFDYGVLTDAVPKPVGRWPAADDVAGLRPDARMLALTRELRELGVRVGLLSDGGGAGCPRESIDALLDPVVISGDVGLRKPGAAVYELTVHRLGIPAGRVLFVDDAEADVLGARAVGLRAFLHTDPVTTRAALSALVPGVSREPLVTAANRAAL
jgi:putative hydrolase of the HAD superfamily